MIDADALKKAIIKYLCVKSENNLLPAEKSIYNLIDKQPTVELLKEKQPKKGHWKKPKFANDRWHECSECGTVTEKVDHNGYKLICNYCPVCGADMRKGEK